MFYKSLNKFIAIFSIVALILAFIIPIFDNTTYIAATVITPEISTIPQETTKKKTVGASMQDAGMQKFETFSWMPDDSGVGSKKTVIAGTNGGGSGEGGGAGDSNAYNAGNSGEYNDAGGVGGVAAGVGQGSGNAQNVAGQGSGTTGGTSGGTTGSALADALRSLKSEINESRAESLARVLETALNQSLVAASIAERESIQQSIQKKLTQESLKAKLISEETKTYETPVYIPQTSTSRRILESTYRTDAPTSRLNITIYDMQETVPAETTLSTVEPGDFVEAKMDKERIQVPLDIKAEIDRPTMEMTENQETEIMTTLKTFDMPIVETVAQETAALESVGPGDLIESETPGMTEEGAGSKGGSEDNDEDKKGDEGKEESLGNADEKGKFHLEKRGEYAGKKVFEIETNGNLGLDPEHLSQLNLRAMMTSFSVLLFILGIVAFLLSSGDKKSKRNYF